MNDYYKLPTSTQATRWPSPTPVRMPCNAFRTAGSTSVSVGYHRITPPRQRPTHIPQQRTSSYGYTHNSDYGESRRRHSLIKRLLIDQPHWTGSPSPVKKVDSAQKALSSIQDVLADRTVSGVRKASFQAVAQLVDMRVEDMRVRGEERRYSGKVSRGNANWIVAKAKETLLRKFSSGEMVPSMEQLSLYGRRATPTRFQEKRLWQVGSLQSLGT